MKKVLSLATLASVIALPLSHSHSIPISEPATLFLWLPTWARQVRLLKHPPFTKGATSGTAAHTDLALLMRSTVTTHQYPAKAWTKTIRRPSRGNQPQSDREEPQMPAALPLY